MNKKSYSISASLVLYKTKTEDLNNIISSVLNSKIDLLYVIDNSPTNFLSSHIQKYNSSKIKYYFGQGNVGFGQGNNIGLEEAIKLNSKYHIVLNPDIIFNPQVIDELATYMDQHQDIGQILPKVTYPDGRLQYLCKHLPTPTDIFARKFLNSKTITNRNSRYEMHYMGYDKLWNCPILSGCFMFIRVDILKEVGLFDPQFFMYFEDFDLMRRIHRKSKTIFYPFVTIIHNHAAEHRHNFKLLKESTVSAIKYFNKWGWIFDKERDCINKDALTSSYL